MILYFLFFCLFSPTISWDPDIIKLTNSEIAAISAKCNRKSAKGTPEAEPTNVSKKSAAPAGLYPFMAFVGKNDQFLCGAVFISPRHLLTARDCLRETNGQGLSLHVGGVSYGGNNGQRDGQTDMRRLQIDSAIFDDQDWGTDTRDLAILQISTALAETVAPIIDIVCLPEKDIPFPTSAVVVGWGRMGLSMPPYYLQHVPVELDSDEHDNSFLSIITYAKQNRAKAIDTNGLREFSQIGRNSSAGNAVVSYSSTSGRYVLHGLLLGSSWAGRFGRVVSDGVKVTPFYSELCNHLQVCGPSYVHPSAAPKLNLTPHRIIPESGRSGIPKSDEQNTNDNDYGSEKMCDRSGVSVDEIFDKHPLATIDTGSGAVTLKHGPNQPDKVLTLQINTRSDFDGAKSSAGNPQLTLQVCPPKDLTNGSSYIVLCWNTPYTASNEPTGVYRSTFNDDFFKYCNDYNYGISFYNPPFGTGITRVVFKHSFEEEDFDILEDKCEPCCEFALVDSPRFSNPKNKDRFSWEYHDKLNKTLKNVRLPMIKLDKGYNVDSVKIKVIARKFFSNPWTESPNVTISGNYAYPCYYLWHISDDGRCDGGVGNETCALWYSVDKSIVNTNSKIHSTVTETGEAVSHAEALEIANEAIAIATTEIITEAVHELEDSIKTSIKTEAKVEVEVFAGSISTELSSSLGKKTSESTTNSIKESFENSSEEKTKQELKNKKDLVTKIETKHKEINNETIQERNKVTRTILSKRGEAQQLCQLKHVCHGRIIDTSITNIFSDKRKNSQN